MTATVASRHHEAAKSFLNNKSKSAILNAELRRQRAADTETALALQDPVAALQDKVDERRRRAVKLLGASGSAEIARCAATVLTDPSATARSAAAEVLGALGAGLAGDLALAALCDAGGRQPDGSSEEVAAVAALVDMGAAIVPPVAALLMDQVAGIRGAAARAIAAMLRDEDGDRRRKAADAMGRVGGASLISVLVGLLGDADWRVRQRAALSLGAMGPDALPALLRALGDLEASTAARDAAVEALAILGSEAVDVLGPLCHHTEESVREAAMACLRKISKTATQSSVAAAAAAALPSAFEAAMSAQQRAASQEGEERMLARMLSDREAGGATRQQAALQLAAKGAAAVPQLVPLLETSTDRQTQRLVERALQSIDDAAIPPEYQARIRRVTRAPARALERFGLASEPSPDEAAALLQHPRFAVRAAAAQLLGASAAEKAAAHADALAVLAVQNPPVELDASEAEEAAAAQTAASEALLGLGEAGAAALQRRLLLCEKPEEAQRAATLLQQLDSSRQFLLPVLADRFGHNATTAAAAAAAVVTAGEELDVGMMRLIAQMAQEDADEDVRRAAADALIWAAGFGVPEAIRLFDQLERFIGRYVGVRAADPGLFSEVKRRTPLPDRLPSKATAGGGDFVMLGCSAVLTDSLLPGEVPTATSVGFTSAREAMLVLSDPVASAPPEVRCAAAEALGAGAVNGEFLTPNGGIGEYASKLVVLLRDREPSVRRAAAEAIAQSRVGAWSGFCTDALRALLGDSYAEVRAAAVLCLGQMGADSSRHAIAIALLLKDPDGTVRRAAVEALGRLRVPGAAQQAAGYLIDVLPEARIAAADALAAMGDLTLRYAAQVVNLLTDYDGDVRNAAVLCLEALNAAPGGAGCGAVETGRLLEHRDEQARRAAIRALGFMGERGLAEALARVAHLEANVQCAALAAIGAVGDTVGRGFGVPLNASELEKAAAAAAAALTPSTTRGLREFRWPVRLEALKALRRLSVAAVPHAALVAPLLKDRDSAVRAEAAGLAAQLASLGQEQRCLARR
eukprot:TRINITY_DN92372_c0_g1_i1.p1 TRINITY_DN92372_c0_g1~~TRINITY_DN92372_c0_g1_i1.p1  ORF type:complete len:1035 (-),score=249.86 TRINITY_DN92372_c0_g1_i1:115-3219(-)